MADSKVVFTTFEDPTAQAEFEAQVAALAAEAISITSVVHRTEINLSFASLPKVEEMMGNYQKAFPLKGARDQQEHILRWGAYLGEVMRAKVGGTWGRVSLEGETFAGLRLGNGQLCWPHDRVRKRMLLGAEYEILGYCEALCNEPRRDG